MLVFCAVVTSDKNRPASFSDSGCPMPRFNIVTLGLFTLVVNAGMLWLSSWIAGKLGVGFHVEGVLAAFFGALLISVVSLVLDLFFGRKGKK